MLQLINRQFQDQVDRLPVTHVHVRVGLLLIGALLTCSFIVPYLYY